MSSSIVTFFPVGDKNGGMTMIRLNDVNKTTIIIDSCIGDEPIAGYCDENQELRSRLPFDANKRPYIDAFILTHRHDDHVKGFINHFHVGSLDDYDDNLDEKKIIIRELWSSHNFWKPASPNYSLCDGAKAFNKEMKRRVDLFKENKTIQSEGNRAIVIGKDPEGRTDDIDGINYKIGSAFNKINNINIASKLKGFILSPIDQQEGEEDECFTDKNRQSIVMQLTVFQDQYTHKLLMAADAECLVWETLWKKYMNDISLLEYDILYAPHHCSWHSLSYDSQSTCESPKVCTDAKNALCQKKDGAFIVSQSKIIKKSDADPPSQAAKKEYLTIVSEDNFICTNEYPNEKKPEPIEFNLTGYGPQKKSIKEPPKMVKASSAAIIESRPHG
jgi:hypothetical protein